MKVILSGGGTGGHIYPALTIADTIKKRWPETEIRFVGTTHGLEKDLVPRAGYPIDFIDVQGFKRSLSPDTFRSSYKVFTGLRDAKKLLDEYQPHLVIGTGGYVCGPVVFLAALKGIPTCVQEQNALPGVTNKILSHFVNRIFLGYQEADKYFKGKAKKVFTGNPIREEILKCNRFQALRFFGLNPAKKTVLIAGGSLGAASINKAAFQLEQDLSGRDDVQIIHATGKNHYEEYKKQIEKAGGFQSNIHVLPYLYDMPMALATADLAVFRAGAIGLAELTAKGIPAILVPFPYATANHQEFNARALEAAGAARVILDKELNGNILQDKVERLLLQEDELEKMKQASAKAGRPKAALEIAEQAVALVHKREN
ncbi:MAG: undecaprenyldiphospho-muramoylpentapeptide beta-N-acetylglucosaminyltransferase [Acidaminococcaceae bacterium]|nr:undecaprenyldiphospho-muramoylpentapeptide beta-N-acetylglucosaminyltransferase [Acidaminococcaceae bacterium]